MMIRTGASPRRRWRLLAALAALVVLQIAGASHLIGHTATGDSAGCAVCLAASGARAAAPTSVLVLPAFRAIIGIVVAPDVSPRPARFSADHRARAPPLSV